MENVRTTSAPHVTSVWIGPKMYSYYERLDLYSFFFIGYPDFIKLIFFDYNVILFLDIKILFSRYIRCSFI